MQIKRRVYINFINLTEERENLMKNIHYPTKG